MSHENLKASTQAATSVGVALKHEHADDLLSGPHAVDFFEVHAENYMGDGGPPHHTLGQVRARYPSSLHGVGAPIGGIELLHEGCHGTAPRPACDGVEVDGAVERPFVDKHA